MLTQFVHWPILEYNNSISLHIHFGQQESIENSTKGHMSDSTMSKKILHWEADTINLPSLHHRRLRADLIFLFKILNDYFTTNFSYIYILISTQDLIPGGINSNCLRNAQGYCVDPIILLIMIRTVYQIML